MQHTSTSVAHRNGGSAVPTPPGEHGHMIFVCFFFFFFTSAEEEEEDEEEEDVREEDVENVGDNKEVEEEWSGDSDGGVTDGVGGEDVEECEIGFVEVEREGGGRDDTRIRHCVT